MKRKTPTYLLFFMLILLTACSLFRKIPIREDENSNETTSISWDDSKYNYQDELSGQQTDNLNNTAGFVTDKKFINQYSEILGFNLRGTENKYLVLESASWIGTKYKYGAAQKQVGTDCSGFVKSVIQTVYDINLNRTAAGMAMESKKIKQTDLKEGDLVFFNIGGSNISHVGIYIRDNYFIHASTSKGVIVSSLEEDYYRKYFFCGGRIK